MADTDIPRWITGWTRERYGDAVTSDVMLLHTLLRRHKDCETRLETLNEWEPLFRTRRDEHARKMLRAVAIWRLRQQL